MEKLIKDTTFSSGIYPYIAKSEWEILEELYRDAKQIFVFVPTDRLARPYSRVRMGERRTEIFAIDKQDARIVRERRAVSLTNRLGGGKLYFIQGGGVYCITDPINGKVDKAKAMRVIRLACGVTRRDDALDERMERQDREAELRAIRDERNAYNTYIRDSRPIERHKFHKAVRTTCDGTTYGSLGNYIGVKRSGTAKVVCKINF